MDCVTKSIFTFYIIPGLEHLCFILIIFLMVLFALFLTYEDEDKPRKVADGCNKQQLLDVLSRHIMLAQVAHFQIVPFDYFVPFNEYTL